MQKQIYPKEAIDYSIESYLPKVGVKSQMIYTTLLVAIIFVFMALPFIFIDISITSPGIVRTLSEKTEIKSLVSGRINSIKAFENQVVKKDEVLFTIDTQELDTKLQLTLFDEKENNSKIKDLSELLKIEKNNLFANFYTQTGIYTQQLNLFRSNIQENIFAQKKIENELIADRQLYKDKVISKRELDNKEYELIKLRSEYESMFQRQKSQWQADLNGFRLQAEQKRTEKNQVIQQKRFYEIKAPVNGNIQQLTGKYEGSFIQMGENLGIISPDSNLIVECYVSPQDIGLLKKESEVVFQIDAFNYNEWGLVKGKVIDIAKDFVLIDNLPIFKVKCNMGKTELSLSNGFKSNIKKGMTLNARFFIAKRSLYQLLYDKADDWLNPNIKKRKQP